ncbi:amidase family protein [Corynebacterium terpenotabidum]|nr:amidase [Corynebacterium terpenotabidum]
MAQTGTPTGAAARLRSAQASTGLSAAELGVARLYDHPHVTMCAEPTGSLTGVEVLVKDLQRVAGETTGFGSPAHEFVSATDDATVRSLLATGAHLVGASVTAEFGATVYTEPDLVGGGPGPVNPVDARMTTGGSSSGAAVAVARGIVAVAHANDGGGSIRIPAAAVGLPGFKPAHRVFGSGVLPNPAAQGFIGADLELTARAYDIPRSPLRSGLRSGLRLGMTTVPFHGDPGQPGPTAVDPQIAAATTAASALLVTHPQVAGVTPVDAPYPVDRFAVFSRIMAARCTTLPDPLGPMPGWLKARGLELASSEIADATASLTALPEDIGRAWPEIDVVVTPTVACAPPPVGAFSALSVAGAHRLDFLAQTAWTPWATLWNLTGWAALSVPLVVPGPGRWPVSVHLGAVGDRVDAATLFALGTHLQAAVARLTSGDAAAHDAFTLTEPGDIEKLGYRPVAPAHSHRHGHGHPHEH